MRLGNVLTRNASLRKYVSVTIGQLNAFDMMLLWVRLSTSVAIVVFVLVLTAFAAAAPNSLYIGRLDTSSVNILKGLFDKLSSSVVSAKLSDINNGVGLTTSEIHLLSQYVDSQVHDVPNYIKTGIYGWCSMRYASEEILHSDGTWEEKANSTKSTECRRIGSGYLLNYRKLLDELGLGIILSYAYGYTYNNGTLDKNNTESEKFERFLMDISLRKKGMIDLLYAVAVMETGILMLMLLYYNMRKIPNQKTKTRIVLHFISLTKLAVFTCALVSVISVTIIGVTFRRKISKELGAFGFTFHLGAAWFGCLWTFAFLNIVSCLVWTGIEWCLTNADSPVLPDENSSMLGVHMLPVQESSEKEFLRDTQSIVPSVQVTRTESNLTRLTDYGNTQKVAPASSFLF